MISVKHLSTEAVGSAHPDYPITAYDEAVATLPVDWTFFIDPEWNVLDATVTDEAKYLPNLARRCNPATKDGYAVFGGGTQPLTTFDNGVDALSFPTRDATSNLDATIQISATEGTWVFVFDLTNDAAGGSQFLAVSDDLAIILRSDAELTVYSGGVGGTTMVESEFGIQYSPEVPYIVLVSYSAEGGATIRIDGAEAENESWSGPLADSDAPLAVELLTNMTGRVGACGYLPADLTLPKYATALAQLEAGLATRYGVTLGA